MGRQEVSVTLIDDTNPHRTPKTDYPTFSPPNTTTTPGVVYKNGLHARWLATCKECEHLAGVQIKLTGSHLNADSDLAEELSQ
ncbi:hypothetical protein BD410DRAFT_784874, partial [Rickenella mellea]